MGQLKEIRVGRVLREGDENGNTNFVCRQVDVCPKPHCPRGHHLKVETLPLLGEKGDGPLDVRFHEDGKTWVRCWEKE